MCMCVCVRARAQLFLSEFKVQVMFIIPREKCVKSIGRV
jgi:hypothetical protein